MVGAALALLAATGLTACDPPAATCSLTGKTRPQVQACIEASPAVTLTGSVTWTINTPPSGGLAGVTVPAGHEVWLGSDASINLRYTATDKRHKSWAVLVDGGDFVMAPGSAITNHNGSVATTYDLKQEARIGIEVRGGGSAAISDASVVANGYAITVTHSGDNELVMRDATAWGIQAVNSVPTPNHENVLDIQGSSLVGTMSVLVVEPNVTTGITGAQLETANTTAMVNTSHFTRLGVPQNSAAGLGLAGLPPQYESQWGHIHFLTPQSRIINNTSYGPYHYMTVWGCMVNQVPTASNGFNVQYRGC